jgi:hypothetical protein
LTGVSICRELPVSNVFVQDRIRWRAAKQGLPAGCCIDYLQASAVQRTSVSAAVHDDAGGVLLFWGDESRWTLLTDTFVASWHHRTLHRCALDEIRKEVRLSRVDHEGAEDLKREAEYIYLRLPNISVWASGGRELFALMNVLLMFPLGKSV